MLRRPKRSKIEAVAPKEKEEISHTGVIRLSEEGRRTGKTFICTTYRSLKIRQQC
jgi:hypothetical protein